MNERDDERKSYHFHFDTDRTDPNVAVIEAVAELEGKEPTEHARLYECIDRVIDRIFTQPPAREANVRVSFDYEGYRIGVDKDGTVMVLQIQ